MHTGIAQCPATFRCPSTRAPALSQILAWLEKDVNTLVPSEYRTLPYTANDAARERLDYYQGSYSFELFKFQDFFRDFRKCCHLRKFSKLSNSVQQITL